MTSFSRPRTRLTLGLAVLTLAGAAALSPARAADFGYGEEIGVRPPVERRVVIEERRIEERRVFSPGESRISGPLGDARPIGFGHPGYARPVFHGHAGYGGPAYGGEGCRLIIKKRVDPWGETVKRIRICD